MTQPPPFTIWSLGRRCVIAAGAGGVLALVWFGLFWLIVSETVCSGWSCIGLGLLGLPASLVVLAVLAWPLLMLFRLPRAWLAALIAPVLIVAFARVAVVAIPLGGSYTFPLAGICRGAIGLRAGGAAQPAGAHPGLANRARGINRLARSRGLRAAIAIAPSRPGSRRTHRIVATHLQRRARHFVLQY